jgi:hypothetical protein
MAAVTFSPTKPKALESTVTVTISGLSASTAHVATLTNSASHQSTIPFTTDGSGNGSFKFVPGAPGTYTVSTVVTQQSVVASGSVTAGGAS